VHIECATCIKESKDALEEVCTVGGFTLMQEYCPAVEDEEEKNAADPAPDSDAAESDEMTPRSLEMGTRAQTLMRTQVQM
jgi:hypothetical protein